MGTLSNWFWFSVTIANVDLIRIGVQRDSQAGWFFYFQLTLLGWKILS